MICGVILAGGYGTRLWPLSDISTPKQFLKLFSNNSMIVETSMRIKPFVPLDKQYVLTGEAYCRLVEEQFEGKINLLIEPAAKNTGPCILWAAMKMQKEYGNDTVLAVLASDHVINDEENFLKALAAAKKKADEGCIVTFGILPDRPDTGFGYIEIDGGSFLVNESVKKIVAFHEKPQREAAEKYLESGRFLWNGGMFVLRADVLIREFERHCSQVYDCFCGIDPDDMGQVAEAFEKSPSISVDYAVMEHTKHGCCIPSDFGWSDVGSYLSLHAVHAKDADGNVTVGDVIAKDTKNSYINGKKRIVCIGMDDVVVVEGEDSILVAKMETASAVGDIAKNI